MSRLLAWARSPDRDWPLVLGLAAAVAVALAVEVGLPLLLYAVYG